MMLFERQQGPPPMGPPPAVPLSANPIAAVLAITCIMFVTVVTKVTFRQWVLKQPGWDDLWTVLGALMSIAMAGTIVSVLKDAGLDSSSAAASPGEIQDPKYANRLFVYLLLSGVPNGFAKLAILCFLLKVFPRVARPVTSYLIYAGVTITTLFYSIQVLYIGIHCGPQNDAPCSVNTQFNIAKSSASVNLILDFYVLAIAVTNVWTLQLTRKRKYGVIIVFMTGLLAFACSIIALYYRYATTTNPDAIWQQVLTPLILVIYEPCIALITACLPVCPALWKTVYETAPFSSVRNLISQLSQSLSSGSVELTDVPSQERLHQRSTSRVSPKHSHDTTIVDLEGGRT